MDDLAWDLIFYGAMAITFIGIIASSAAARRKKRAESAGTGAPGNDRETGGEGDKGGG